MKGIVKNTISGKNFGFILSNKIEHFFHREDFNGHWDDLVNDVISLKAEGEKPIEVTFDIVDAPKGPRAINVRRLDFPNQT